MSLSRGYKKRNSNHHEQKHFESSELYEDLLDQKISNKGGRDRHRSHIIQKRRKKY